MLDRGTNSEQYLINQTVKRYSIKRMRASKRGFPIFKLAGVILLLAAIGAGVALVLNPQRIRDAKAAYTICETEGFVCKPSTYTCAQTFSSLNDCDDVYGSGYKCGKDCYLPTVPKTPTPTPKPAAPKPTATPTPKCQTGTFYEACGYSGTQWCPKNTSCNTGWTSGPNNNVFCGEMEKLVDTGTYCLRWDGKRSWNGSVSCVYDSSCVIKCAAPVKKDFYVQCGAGKDLIQVSWNPVSGATQYNVKLWTGSILTLSNKVSFTYKDFVIDSTKYAGATRYYTVKVSTWDGTTCNSPSGYVNFGTLKCP